MTMGYRGNLSKRKVCHTFTQRTLAKSWCEETWGEKQNRTLRGLSEKNKTKKSSDKPYESMKDWLCLQASCTISFPPKSETSFISQNTPQPTGAVLFDAVWFNGFVQTGTRQYQQKNKKAWVCQQEVASTQTYFCTEATMDWGFGTAA